MAWIVSGIAHDCRAHGKGKLGRWAVKRPVDVSGNEPESEPRQETSTEAKTWEIISQGRLEGVLEATGHQGLEPFTGFRRPNSWVG